MTKKMLITLSFLIQSVLLFAQPFEIRANKVDGKLVDVNPASKKVNGLFDQPITSLFVHSTNVADAAIDFKVIVNGTDFATFKGNETSKELKNPAVPDLRNKKIEITKGAPPTTLTEFTFQQQPVFEIKVTTGSSALKFKEGVSEQEFTESISKLFVTTKEPIDENMMYTLIVQGDKVCGKFKSNGTQAEISCTMFKDLRDIPITIMDENQKTQFFSFSIKGKMPPPPPPSTKLKSAILEIKSKFPSLTVTNYGLQVPAGNRNTVYTGSKYVHIFLDQFGNNILSTIPQGIANRQYVVHIFYIENADDPNQIDYSVNQTTGQFEDVLVFNNSGQLSTIVEPRAGGENVNNRWASKEFLLSTSTTDIQFEVTRTALKSQDALKQEFENQTLKTYTIKMSKVSHGSFDVGLINSTLKNPTFELVTSPTNSAEKVVKQTEGSNRGVVTAMATFYASPIIILEDIFGGRNIPNYMLSGRNFLEDHKIYERIYPAVGVGFTDRTLENLFFGFNWEFARGGSIFAGWHYGKVNVYNKTNGFNFEQTPTTTDEFNLRKNIEWKTKFALGLNLDIMIIRNLFRGSSNTSGSSED